MPCQMVQNKLDDMGVTVESIDAFENPSMAGKFDIGSVPTLVLVDEDNKEVSRSIGFNPDEIEKMVELLDR